MIETPEGNKALFEKESKMLSKMLADTQRKYKEEKNIFRKMQLHRMLKVLETMRK